MRKEAKQNPSLQVLYVGFDDGAMFYEYYYSRSAGHAEEQMALDFHNIYTAQRRRNYGAVDGAGVSQVFMYSYFSPCNENGHYCGRVLGHMPKSFPVNNFYHLGYTKLYGGIVGHQSPAARAAILGRSTTGLAELSQAHKWKVHVVE
jgi:hypothetical protein